MSISINTNFYSITLILTLIFLLSVMSIIEGVTNDLLMIGDGVTSMTAMADNHGLGITAISENRFQGFSFDVDTNSDGSINGIMTYPFASSSLTISIPETLFMDLGTDVPSNVTGAFSVFETDNLFPSHSSNTSTVASLVVSASIVGVLVNVSNASKPVIITLEMKESEAADVIQQYYNIISF